MTPLRAGWGRSPLAGEQAYQHYWRANRDKSLCSGWFKLPEITLSPEPRLDQACCKGCQERYRNLAKRQGGA